MKKNAIISTPVAENESIVSTPFTRRSFLGTGLALAGAAGTGLITPAQATAQTAKPAPSVTGRKMIASDTKPVVETQYGKIRGSIHDGIYSFKGVPYGANTGGANRWMMAKEPTPWAGIRSSVCYSYTCPTLYRTGWSHDEERFISDWSDGVAGEDVLNLSVWTPGIYDNKKRPVLVWIHGGGYTGGSNEELKSYDGERLARRGDIIVVGLNHRLNILAFLNLEKFGDQYKNSQNNLHLDLVAGLKWIKNNIANFGGDPDAVTVFGQSGGGGKVTYLAGMPAAKGLFRAIAMESPASPRKYTQEDSVTYSDSVLDALGIKSAADLPKLHAMTYDQLLAGWQSVGRRAGGSPPPLGRSLRQGGGLAFQPSTGPVFPELPFYPNSPAIAANVPLLTGAVLNEFGNSIQLANPALEDLTKEQVIAGINLDFPGKGEALYAAFEKLKLPGRGVPFDIFTQMLGITSFRANAVHIAQVRAATPGQAPAYNYQFRWQSPTFDGRPRAFHTAGLQFAFDNVERCASATGNGPDAQALADVMSEAFIAFVKTGNPNHKGMPKWDPVTADKVSTMIFDNKVEQLVDFDKEQMAMLAT